MTSCDYWIKFYADKYHITSEICNGPSIYPNSSEEMVNAIENIGDDWDQQIACVLTGDKKVAMTDYGSFDLNEADDLKEYYENSPKDTELREIGLTCGVNHLYSNDGTEFWFRKEYHNNAEILINHYNGSDEFPTELYTTIQSLLLGYNEVSIILYELFNDLASYNRLGEISDSQTYLGYIEKYRREMLPLINKAKTWINKRNGNVA